MAPNLKVPASGPLPAQPPLFVLSPWKMFAWGVVLGVLLGLAVALLSPWARRYMRVEEARTQVEVKRILGECR